MMLQLKVSHGQGWSEKDFKDAAKQGIQVPNSVNDIVYQIANNIEIFLFFFGDNSVLTSNLLRLHRSIRMHIITFRAVQLRLPSFAAKFSYAINTQTFRWLKMCRDIADCSQVDNTLVNFDTLL